MVEPKKRLLIIDDNTEYAGAMSRALSDDYEIKIVSTKADAYGELDSTKYDIILTDLDLEEDGSRREGLDVVTYAKKSKQNIDTSVVLGSAALKEDIIKEAKSRGANATLKKPFNLSDLRRTLAEKYEKKKEE